MPKSLFSQSCRPLRKETPAQVFSVNFARSFRTPILYNICERLLLVLVRVALFGVLQFYRCFASLCVSQYLRYWDAIFNWFYTDEHPTNVLTLITQWRWYRRYILIFRHLQGETLESSQFEWPLSNDVSAPGK